MLKISSRQCGLFLSFALSICVSKASFGNEIKIIGKIDLTDMNGGKRGVISNNATVYYFENNQFNKKYITVQDKRFPLKSAVEVQADEPSESKGVITIQDIKSYEYSASDIKYIKCELEVYCAGVFQPRIIIEEKDGQFKGSAQACLPKNAHLGMSEVVYNNLFYSQENPKVIEISGENGLSSMMLSIPIYGSRLDGVKGVLTIKSKRKESPSRDWVDTGEDMEVTCNLSI